MTADRSSELIYIGTYTDSTLGGWGRSEGIFIYSFDALTGRLEPVSAVSGVINPSFLAISPGGRHLYAVNEVAEFAGQSGGGVSAFAIDAETGRLTLLNARPTFGAAPCYVSVDKTGKWALVANYSGGSVTVLPILDDGQLGAPTLIQHHGHSIHPQRQDAPHAHCVIPDPANQNVLVSDLGLDKIMVYRLDSTTGILTRNWEINAKPGAGPRHLEFHPNGRVLYVSNELASTVSVFDYDSIGGKSGELQTVSALPPDYRGSNLCADLHVAPSGKFLYVSNRGHDSLAVFVIEEGTGRLALSEIVPSGGRTPRNFGFDWTGNWLLVAHQDSDNVIVFKADTTTGHLLSTGHSVSIPRPVCVRFGR